MSEVKHTPGPWRVCGGYTPAYTAVHSERGYIIFGMADHSMHREGLPAKPITAPDAEEQRVNAHLIAAAPEMLEALKWAEGVIGLYSKDPAPGSGIMLIRNAIAKAEGRTP